MLLDQAADGPFKRLLIDQQDVVDKIADHWLGYPARFFHRNAFGECLAATDDVPAGYGEFHRRVEFGLDTVDFQVWAHVAGDGGNAADQSAAADRHDKRVHIIAIGQHFQPGRALAGHDQLVVIGMDQGQTAFFDQLRYQHLAFIQVASLENHLGTERAGARNLGKWGLCRHHDNGRYAHIHRVIGNGLGVVSRRHGDHAALALLGAEGLHRHESAARLEG